MTSPYSTTSTVSPMVPQRPCPTTRMPLELVLLFLDAAGSAVDHDVYADLLMTCSLVCRAWSTSAQKLLFSQVTLRSQQSFEQFMNAVDHSTHHGRVLGDVVKLLRVVLDHNQPSSLHHHSFALAVNTCPNLSELEISLYGCAEPGQDILGLPAMSRLRRAAPSFDDQTLSLLKAGPKIEHLHFDNWSENQQSIFQLLDIWPSLQYLSIGGKSQQHLQDSPTPFSCSLLGLRLNFQTTPSVDFLKWLLHNSTNSLQTLHFQRDPSLEAFEYLVDNHASNLQAISFPAFGSPDFATILKKCSRLRDLRTEHPACPLGLSKQLPNQIEHLAFGIDRDTVLNTIVDVVKTSNALKTVDVQVWDSGPSHHLLAPLRIACTYRGIGLSITKDLRVFRTMNMTKKTFG